MFANPNHPTVEYHYRPDGTRPYSHCEDRDLFRVINVEGDCVYYLRKLTDVFRVALTAVGMTIDQATGFLEKVMDGPWDNLEGEANCLLGLKDFLFDEAVQVKSSKYKMLERILLYGTFETIDSKLYRVSQRILDQRYPMKLSILGLRICAALLDQGLADRQDLERMVHHLRRLPGQPPANLPPPAVVSPPSSPAPQTPASPPTAGDGRSLTSAIDLSP